MATRKKYTSGADLILMTDEDLEQLGKFGDAWNAAHAAGDQAGMDAAHAGAEALRAKYNYSGGADGSEYNPWGDSRWNSQTGNYDTSKWQSNTAATRPNRVESMEPFSYESAPEYVNRYQDQIDGLLNDILNRPEFSYDPDTDPMYAAFRKEYQREGQRATADTMGQYAAMTGGMPSTAATVAAQQAGDYYAAQMADRIPELYQLAYSMYQDEGDNMRLNMDMLTALEQGDYNKYLNLLNQYNTDRNFAYGVYSDEWNRNYQLDRDDIADQRYDLEWNYGVNRDQINDQRYDREWNYGVNRDEVEDQRYQTEWDYATALDRAQTLAQAGDFSGYKALGYSDSEIASLQNAYNRALAAQTLSRSGGSSGRSSRSSGSSKPRLTYAQTLQAIEDGRITDSVISAYDYYMGDGAYEAAYRSESGGSDAEPSLNDLNTDSVLQLGIGPLSFEAVEELADEGKVSLSTDSNGKIVVRWANGYNASNYRTNLRDNGFFHDF